MVVSDHTSILRDIHYQAVGLSVEAYSINGNGNNKINYVRVLAKRCTAVQM